MRSILSYFKTIKQPNKKVVGDELECPKEDERESWSNHCEFFVSSLGLAVGLGNMWRFPYVCYVNGGGTFLIPYLIMLLFVGIPGLFLEQSTGQYARKGVNKVFGRMVPLFKGLGYTIVVISILNQMYYAVVCGWSFFYMFAGFQSKLPWINCADGENWHSPNCYMGELAQKCREDQFNKDNDSSVALTWYNGTCVNMTTYCQYNGYDGGQDNHTTSENVNFNCVLNETKFVDIQDVIAENAVTPAEDYFNGLVLGYTKGSSGETYTWYDFGSIQWESVLCMLLVWLAQLLILFKGLKVYGKVAYFMTLSPYFVLTAFLAYGVTLPGAINGISYFIKPDWNKIWEVNVWYSAASQILFSLSLGWGSQFALCSYNNFKNNTLRDSILIGICNSATSIFAGFVVFTILGFLANKTGVPIEKVVNDGITLGFVSYPSAMAHMDMPPLWSFLFFFMLINLAVSTGCSSIQTVAAFVMDEWPSLRNRRMSVFTFIAASLFILGLPMCCQGGILLFTLFDERLSSSLIFIVWIEIVVVTWFYGINQFIDNIQEMGMKFGLSRPTGVIRIVLIILLAVVAPGMLIVVAVIGWRNREPISYGGESFPLLVESFGWLLELGPLTILPMMAIWTIGKLGFSHGFSITNIWEILVNPSKSWYEVNRNGEDETTLEDKENNFGA